MNEDLLPPDAVLEEPEEELDAVPVLSDVRTIERRGAAPLVVQAAAVAVSGFVAGAATVAVVRHHRIKKAVKRRKGVGQIAASRSFLIDVHLIGGRD